MYKYDEIDQSLVQERSAQFAEQVIRRLKHHISEDEFKPLRLQNGLYLQRHAYMLRVAIPYGMLSSTQLRTLANIAKYYDRGYGHFTTRQNIQFNWIDLQEAPLILEELAAVQMHAIQTSGNCIRNITSDPFAGVAADEYIDPRPICELLRQWSTLHPEFAFLPRKFKIAVNGALLANIYAGGGMGRTPMLAELIKTDLPWHDLPAYLTALLRVYNLHGRRDNIYKARIKILVKALGVEEFARQVEEEWTHTQLTYAPWSDVDWQRVAQHFTKPPYKQLPKWSFEELALQVSTQERIAFLRWLERNVREHQTPGYSSVILSLKPHGTHAPGDATAEQMNAIADLADRYSFGELRVTHEQNLVLADVETNRLIDLWKETKSHGLALSNIGLLTDIIACPGGDFCSLANAKSIPIAKAIQERFDHLDYLHDIGELSINISGCINSCGHHHVGNIGILGVDKDGEEWFQITLGGAQGHEAAIGKVIGRAFLAEEIPDVIDRLITVYIQKRQEGEQFIQTVWRLDLEPFKKAAYAHDDKVEVSS